MANLSKICDGVYTRWDIPKSKEVIKDDSCQKDSRAKKESDSH